MQPATWGSQNYFAAGFGSFGFKKESVFSAYSEETRHFDREKQGLQYGGIWLDEITRRYLAQHMLTKLIFH